MSNKLREILAVGAALALGVALAGCGQAAPAPNVVVDAQEASHTITVTATSEVKVVPDMASFGVTINTTGDEAQEAQRANDELVNAVVDRLKAGGVPAESIQTTYTWVNPNWTYDEETGEERVVDYEAYTHLQVSDVTIDDAAQLMRAVVDAGATGIDGISYYSSDYDKAYEEALAAAVEASRPKAEAIAQASGVELGSIIGVTEGYQDTSVRYVAEAEEAAMDAGGGEFDAAKIEPGQVAIEASVTVSYAIG